MSGSTGQNGSSGGSRRIVMALLKAAPLLLLLAAAWQQAQAREFRSADIHPAGYPTVEAVEYMSEVLLERSGGRLGIKVYSGAQLGEERDTLEQTVFGAVDLNRLNLPVLNNVVAETTVLTLPFIFRSREHYDRVLNGPIGEEILAAMEPYGLIGLAFYDSGERSMYSPRKAIRHPDDLRGMRIRVQNSDVAVAMIEALGGNATPMEFGQVYEALRNGAIDGAENNWPSFSTTRHFEVAHYYSLTQHSMVPEVLVMSKLTWDGLPAADQALVRQAARESVARMRRLWDERVAIAHAHILAAGNEVIEDIDKAPFIEAVKPVYERFASSPALQDLVRRILETDDE
jgi:tripartite ATP-independent transporter DctP family solute receptor